MSRPMAKTLDEIARELIGSFALEAAVLRYENAMLIARVNELTPKPDPPPAPEGST